MRVCLPENRNQSEKRGFAGWGKGKTGRPAARTPRTAAIFSQINVNWICGQECQVLCGRPARNHTNEEQTEKKVCPSLCVLFGLLFFCVSSLRKSGAKCRRLCVYFFFSTNTCALFPTFCLVLNALFLLFCLRFSQLSCCRQPPENAILAGPLELSSNFYFVRIAVSHIVPGPCLVI